MRKLIAILLALLVLAAANASSVKADPPCPPIGAPPPIGYCG